MEQSIRTCGPQPVQLERFKEASDNKDTGLTFSALTGADKQSIVDAEKLISPAVLHFMKDKGYDEKSRLVEACLDWHKATDERGLSQDQRQKCNMKTLQFIHEELTPWYSTDSSTGLDYSTLEVIRCFKLDQAIYSTSYQRN